jgi:hypothetical protein
MYMALNVTLWGNNQGMPVTGMLVLLDMDSIYEDPEKAGEQISTALGWHGDYHFVSGLCLDGQGRNALAITWCSVDEEGEPQGPHSPSSEAVYVLVMDENNQPFPAPMIDVGVFDFDEE